MKTIPNSTGSTTMTGASGLPRAGEPPSFVERDLRGDNGLSEPLPPCYFSSSA